MAKSTHPITYVYDVKGVTVALTRRHTGTAYPRNGNVGNPTEYFAWEARVNGEYSGTYPDRSAAYEHARARVLRIPYRFDPRRPGTDKNVRSYVVVRDEMKANYRSKSVL